MARNQKTVFPISSHFFAVQVHVTTREKFIKTAGLSLSGLAYIPHILTKSFKKCKYGISMEFLMDIQVETSLLGILGNGPSFECLYVY